jgi:hypothetical protein
MSDAVFWLVPKPCAATSEFSPPRRWLRLMFVVEPLSSRRRRRLGPRKNHVVVSQEKMARAYSFVGACGARKKHAYCRGTKAQNSQPYNNHASAECLRDCNCSTQPKEILLLLLSSAACSTATTTHSCFVHCIDSSVANSWPMVVLEALVVSFTAKRAYIQMLSR